MVAIFEQASITYIFLKIHKYGLCKRSLNIRGVTVLKHDGSVSTSVLKSRFGLGLANLFKHTLNRIMKTLLTG